MEEANLHLMNVLDEINNKCSFGKKKSSKELLEKERKNLLPEMPLYETSKIQDCRVNKYSTVMIDSCYYSVPDNYVGKVLRCTLYTNKIIVFYNEEKV